MYFHQSRRFLPTSSQHAKTNIPQSCKGNIINMVIKLITFICTENKTLILINIFAAHLLNFVLSVITA